MVLCFGKGKRKEKKRKEKKRKEKRSSSSKKFIEREKMERKERASLITKKKRARLQKYTYLFRVRNTEF